MAGDDETPVIGFWSGFIWLLLMTCIVALLSEYVVETIEVSSPKIHQIILKKKPNYFLNYFLIKYNV